MKDRGSRTVRLRSRPLQRAGCLAQDSITFQTLGQYYRSVAGAQSHLAIRPATETWGTRCNDEIPDPLRYLEKAEIQPNRPEFRNRIAG